MNVGYARVPTGEQTLDLQLDALAKAECGKVFTETAGGALVERASLDAMALIGAQRTSSAARDSCDNCWSEAPLFAVAE
jgi:hypothetical protein